ncbi:MAG: SAM hydrolase/SAM-dependent halogenase family protein [Solirubrobacterales bacterium]
MALRPISFLSDFGHRDEWVGVCHGVIERIAPGATVIDIAHDLPPTNVPHAAFVFENAVPFLPAGVLLAVVDPGVGTRRRAVALRSRSGRLLVGPDNGLLWPAARAAGGAEAAVDLAVSPFRLDSVSATFHGRDVFAPVAAHLALGAALEDAGTSIDPATLTQLDAAAPSATPGSLRAAVRLVDRFGNVQLQARPADMEAAALRQGARVAVAGPAGQQSGVYGETFADAPAREVVVYRDSSGWIAVALNGESAAEALGARTGASLTVSRCDP